MPEGKKAQLDIIDDHLHLHEAVVLDVFALLLDPGGGLKKREAEGSLVLTDHRLIFGTARHGILLDLSTKDIKLPVKISYRFMMARLLIKTDGGREHTLVVNKAAARRIAVTVNREPSA